MTLSWHLLKAKFSAKQIALALEEIVLFGNWLKVDFILPSAKKTVLQPESTECGNELPI